MTVQELIDALKQFPPHFSVWVRCECDAEAEHQVPITLVDYASGAGEPGNNVVILFD